jgi:hypothetical protein
VTSDVRTFAVSFPWCAPNIAISKRTLNEAASMLRYNEPGTRNQEICDAVAIAAAMVVDG